MSKIKCFVVDDNHEIREELKSFFASGDFIEFVGEAKDGVEAIAKIAQTQPDVVVLDLVMPVLDGYGVLDYFKNEKRKPKFLVYSALSMDDFIFRAFASGADDYMAKPCRNELIEKHIRALADKSPLTKFVPSSPSEAKATYRSKTLDERITAQSPKSTKQLPVKSKGLSDTLSRCLGTEVKSKISILSSDLKFTLRTKNRQTVSLSPLSPIKC